jgi:hypothetical protein
MDSSFSVTVSYKIVISIKDKIQSSILKICFTTESTLLIIPNFDSKWRSFFDSIKKLWSTLPSQKSALHRLAVVPGIHVLNQFYEEESVIVLKQEQYFSTNSSNTNIS